MEFSRAIRTRVLSIDPRAVTFARRGFAWTSREKVVRLEAIGAAFVRGYGAALESLHTAELGEELDRLPAESRGFGYEGAAMALELLDRLSLARGPQARVQRLLEGAGRGHVYMIHIGAGWAWARLGVLAGRLGTRLRALDPVLGWFALDGFGFHEAYFHPRRTVQALRVPARLETRERQVFDTGVGRALWFVAGADPDGVADRIEAFPPGRRTSLWAGAGLACCYAGGASSAEIRHLARRAGRHRGAIAQGAAFAAKARERAGIPAPHTSRAVEILCGTSASDAARRCDAELAAPAVRQDFHRWRDGLRRGFERRLAADAEGAAELRVVRAAHG